MRILVASHTYIVDLNREKLRALAQWEPGIEVTVVVPQLWQPGGVQNQTIKSQLLEEESFRVVPVSNFSQNNQGLLTFGVDLITLLRQFRPQIMQVEQGAKALTYAQFITLNKLLGLKAKNLFFTWWNVPYEVKFPVSWLEKYNLSNSHGIIAGNQDGAEVLRQHGYQGPMKIIPQLGVDESLFCPQEQPELQEELGINSDEFVVGFVGRFVEEKGLLTLLESLAGLTEKKWKWLLLGRGQLAETLRKKAAEKGIAERLIWVESVPHDRVYRYINVMDTLVLPSEATDKFKTLTAAGWKEQFGHVLIEAMACHVPVIGSDSGEIPYVIGEAGLVFPEGNVPQLRDRLLQLMDNPDFAQDLGKRGRDRVLGKYTNKALAQQQLEFYKELSDR